MRWLGADPSRALVLASRLGLAGLTAAGILAAAPVPAQAVVSGAGNCTGNGYSVPRSAGKPADINAAKTASAAGGTTVDFKTQTDWFVASYKDYLAGRGESPTGSMSSGFANVVFFGIHLPVIGGTGHGTTGQGGPISAADVLPGPLSGHAVASVLVAYGVAIPDGNPPPGQTPAAGPCSGYIVIHFQDVGALDSAVGQAGVALMVLGALGVIALALRRVR